MYYLPFQLDNFRIPVLAQYPSYTFSEGNVWAEHSLKDGGVFLGGVSRKSTKETAIVGLFQKENDCWADCNQCTITEFECQINKLKNKEIKILCIGQDDKVYETTGVISSPIATPLDCDTFTYNIPLRMNTILRDVTSDLWIDTDCNDGLCPEWKRAKDLAFCNIDKNCEVFKTFFRPDFVPDFPEYFPTLRSSLLFNNGQMVTLGGQAIIYTGGFENPYPEILETSLSVPICQGELELFYFFDPPAVGLTSRKIYINEKAFDIPIPKTMLMVANGKIYTGTAFGNLQPVDTFNNQLYDQNVNISYANNLNTKDYYAYYKPINYLI
jgi:hypothetical protein